jgi:hypothetical protein
MTLASILELPYAVIIAIAWLLLFVFIFLIMPVFVPVPPRGQPLAAVQSWGNFFFVDLQRAVPWPTESTPTPSSRKKRAAHFPPSRHTPDSDMNSEAAGASPSPTFPGGSASLCAEAAPGCRGLTRPDRIRLPAGLCSGDCLVLFSSVCCLYILVIPSECKMDPSLIDLYCC